jgi:hypothetical protein
MVVESVRNRIRPPLGSCANPHTGARNVSFNRAGKRRSTGLSSSNQGNPFTVRRASGKEIRCRSGVSLSAANREMSATQQNSMIAVRPKIGDFIILN